MKEDAMKLLRLMGFPVIEAKAEAEAQCVQLVSEGLASAVASDDMDCLTFGAKTLIRQIRTKKDPVVEISLENVLKELGLNMEEFIDMCILCGCDYVDGIEGIGPIKAFQLIKEHHTIERVIAHLEEVNAERLKEDKQLYKFPSPENFDYKTARELFKHPDVHVGIKDIQWTKAKEDELTAFLVDEKGFGAERVEHIKTRLKACQSAKPQMSLESFFGKPKPKVVEAGQDAKNGGKGAPKANPSSKKKRK